MADNNEWKLKYTDLFRGVSFHEDAVSPSIKVPDDFYQRLLDFFMERSYLNDTGDRRFASIPRIHGSISWLRITHLPVNPSNEETYDLLNRWQGVLSTMHAWNYRLLFLLLRSKGETRLYLGTTSFSQNVRAKEAVEQLREAAVGSMPGVGLKHIDDPQELLSEIAQPLSEMPDAGAITGIPSFRTQEKTGKLQTLDPLAFGIRDNKGVERDYALLVVADPIADNEVAGLISRHRELGSNIHTAVSRSVSASNQQTENQRKGVGGAMATQAIGGLTGNLLGSLASMIPVIGPIAGQTVKIVSSSVAGGIAADLQKQYSRSSSASVTDSYLDKYAQYAEELLDKHIDRMKQGRNLGFWNTGVYVLGRVEDIRTVTGMLRSVYSGQETYIEPIRTHLFNSNSGAKEIIKSFDLLPMTSPERIEKLKAEAAAKKQVYLPEEDTWHILGKPYQYLSTPLNTAELSLATSLPHRDVPGLRFVKTAIRFASNPAQASTGGIHLGKVVDMGIQQDVDYRIDPNILVRHAFVCGVTGCGKSTTCKHLLDEMLARNIPIMVIEPAKDDYVRWAVEKNKVMPPEKQIQIYVPGGSQYYEGTENLELNLFQPASVPGANIDLMQHSENLSMLLNASLPSEDVIPILIDETVNRQVERFAGQEVDLSDMPPRRAYPKIDALISRAEEVMDGKGYDPKVRENMKEILLTRFNYLKRGTRGKIFNVNTSMDFTKLFTRPTVINISRLAGSKEKALVMSLLLLAMYEYRISAYQNDTTYRAEAQKNKLMHLMLIEEAHNVLAAPPQTASGDPRQAAADLFSNILSEIRGYGQGIVVVDQTPAKMIPDVIKNTNLKICHRMVSPDDCEVIGAGMALREDQRMMIPSLEIGNAIVCGDMDDAATWVKIPKPSN